MCVVVERGIIAITVDGKGDILVRKARREIPTVVCLVKDFRQAVSGKLAQSKRVSLTTRRTGCSYTGKSTGIRLLTRTIGVVDRTIAST